MGIIGFVYSTDCRIVHQPIYITCRTRKNRTCACAEEGGQGDVGFVFFSEGFMVVGIHDVALLPPSGYSPSSFIPLKLLSSPVVL